MSPKELIDPEPELVQIEEAKNESKSLKSLEDLVVPDPEDNKDYFNIEDKEVEVNVHKEASNSEL